MLATYNNSACLGSEHGFGRGNGRRRWRLLVVVVLLIVRRCRSPGGLRRRRRRRRTALFENALPLGQTLHAGQAIRGRRAWRIRLGQRRRRGRLGQATSAAAVTVLAIHHWGGMAANGKSTVNNDNNRCCISQRSDGGDFPRARHRRRSPYAQTHTKRAGGTWETATNEANVRPTWTRSPNCRVAPRTLRRLYRRRTTRLAAAAHTHTHAGGEYVCDGMRRGISEDQRRVMPDAHGPSPPTTVWPPLRRRKIGGENTEEEYQIIRKHMRREYFLETSTSRPPSTQQHYTTTDFPPRDAPRDWPTEEDAKTTLPVTLLIINLTRDSHPRGIIAQRMDACWKKNHVTDDKKLKEP